MQAGQSWDLRPLGSISKGEVPRPRKSWRVLKAHCNWTAETWKVHNTFHGPGIETAVTAWSHPNLLCTRKGGSSQQPFTLRHPPLFFCVLVLSWIFRCPKPPIGVPLGGISSAPGTVGAALGPVSQGLIGATCPSKDRGQDFEVAHVP